MNSSWELLVSGQDKIEDFRVVKLASNRIVDFWEISEGLLDHLHSASIEEIPIMRDLRKSF